VGVAGVVPDDVDSGGEDIAAAPFLEQAMLESALIVSSKRTAGSRLSNAWRR